MQFLTRLQRRVEVRRRRLPASPAATCAGVVRMTISFVLHRGGNEQKRSMQRSEACIKPRKKTYEWSRNRPQVAAFRQRDNN
jgi:hypothetical protein